MKGIKPYHGAGLLLWMRDEQGKPNVLLGKRSIEPGKGKWSIPGGKWDPKKDIDTDGNPDYLKTALRETEEEIKLVISENEDFLKIWTSHIPFFHYIVYSYQVSTQRTFVHRGSCKIAKASTDDNITTGKYEEFLLDAFRADIVFGPETSMSIDPIYFDTDCLSAFKDTYNLLDPLGLLLYNSSPTDLYTVQDGFGGQRYTEDTHYRIAGQTFTATVSDTCSPTSPSIISCISFVRSSTRCFRSSTSGQSI